MTIYDISLTRKGIASIYTAPENLQINTWIVALISYDGEKLWEYSISSLSYPRISDTSEKYVLIKTSSEESLFAISYLLFTMDGELVKVINHNYLVNSGLDINLFNYRTRAWLNDGIVHLVLVENPVQNWGNETNDTDPSYQQVQLVYTQIPEDGSAKFSDVMKLDNIREYHNIHRFQNDGQENLLIALINLNFTTSILIYEISLDGFDKKSVYQTTCENLCQFTMLANEKVIMIDSWKKGFPPKVHMEVTILNNNVSHQWDTEYFETQSTLLSFTNAIIQSGYYIHHTSSEINKTAFVEFYQFKGLNLNRTTMTIAKKEGVVSSLIRKSEYLNGKLALLHQFSSSLSITSQTEILIYDKILPIFSLSRHLPNFVTLSVGIIVTTIIIIQIITRRKSYGKISTKELYPKS